LYLAPLGLPSSSSPPPFSPKFCAVLMFFSTFFQPVSASVTILNDLSLLSLFLFRDDPLPLRATLREVTTFQVEPLGFPSTGRTPEVIVTISLRTLYLVCLNRHLPFLALPPFYPCYRHSDLPVFVYPPCSSFYLRSA